MSNEPTYVDIRFNADRSGSLSIPLEALHKPIWARLKLALRTKSIDHIIVEGDIKLAWPDVLNVVKELGSKESQKSLDFRFRPDEVAKEKLREFSAELRATQTQRSNLTDKIPVTEIPRLLRAQGFTKRELKTFQLRDLSHLLSLSNGANFSVPGAGKTTVTFALHLLTREARGHLLVVAPKSAFEAWLSVVSECVEEDAPNKNAEPFTILMGTGEEIEATLNSGASRFLIHYDLIVRRQSVVARHFIAKRTHLVLDESHRMKAGWSSLRGSYFLRIADDPIRRDILTGTPMPQAASDMEPQLDFLWPGHGYGFEISQGKAPRNVLGNLYVRTTKKELELPEAKRHFIDIEMDSGQLALYSIVRNEFVRDYSKRIANQLGEIQLLRARKSVMRLLQLSVNPVLALTAMGGDDVPIDSAVVDAVLERGHSGKMRAVMDHARDLADMGRKSVIWTIFTDTIHSFASSLADLNPVYVHGGVRSGDPSEPESREGRIRRFHEDDSCFVLIANPAAAGEGLSLHEACHDAIYADRSYVSTHYIQSIDRIHRLGLAPSVETHIHIYRSKAPALIGSIDMSVSRRLLEKILNMQALLDDPDLHELALDEEEAGDPLDFSIDLPDIMDLIAELEGRASTAPLEEQ